MLDAAPVDEDTLNKDICCKETESMFGCWIYTDPCLVAVLHDSKNKTNDILDVSNLGTRIYSDRLAKPAKLYQLVA